MSSFRSKSEDILSQTLGCKSKEVLSDISKNIDSKLSSGIKKLNDDLVKINGAKGNSVNNALLDEGCSNLHRLLKEQLEVNFNKFNAYAVRNIFTVSEVSNTKSSSNKDLLDKKHQEISGLRQKYNELVVRHGTLSNENKQMEMVLSDMRNALFQLRVGAQVLDEYNVQPLVDTMAHIQSQKQILIDLCQKSIELASQMRQSSNTDAPDEYSLNDTLNGLDGVDFIEAPASDITKLTKSIRK